MPGDLARQVFYHWREVPQVSILSRQTRLLSQQTYAFSGKSFVGTKKLSPQNTCFVATIMRKKVSLSRQNYACRDKYLSRQTFCRDKNMFAATKVFDATSITFCRNKNGIVAVPANDKNVRIV